jgi:hypothetical protein
LATTRPPPTNDRGNQGRQQILYQRRHNRTEGATDHDSDGEIHDIATQ